MRGANDRRGKIWGELVPWGMSDLGFNGCKSCPWRAGANENTTFKVSHDVKVQGQPLPAGTYGLHMIPGQDEWTVIFSKDANSWGSFWYDASKDALRVTTKASKSDYHEWLDYEFTQREKDKATVAPKWEELQIPFTITVDNANQLWVDQMRAELRQSARVFLREPATGGEFLAQNKFNLAEGLTWTEGRLGPHLAGRRREFLDPGDAGQPPGAERYGPGGGEDVRQGAQSPDGHAHSDPPDGAPAHGERKEGPGGAGLPINASAFPTSGPSMSA